MSVEHAVSTKAAVRPEHAVSIERASVDFGRRRLRIETSRFAALVSVRSIVVSGLLALLIVVAGLASMTIGAYEIDFGAVLHALFDPASDPDNRQVVLEWRLPRVRIVLESGSGVGRVIGASGLNPTIAELGAALAGEGGVIASDEQSARDRFGTAFADALLLSQQADGAKARSLGWMPVQAGAA